MDTKRKWALGVAIVAAVVLIIAIVMVIVSSPRQRFVDADTGHAVPALAPNSPTNYPTSWPAVDTAEARRLLNEQIAAYRKAGQPVTVEDFRPKPIDPADDGAPLLLQAIKFIDDNNKDPLWNLNFSTRLTDSQWKTLETSVEKFKPTLALIDQGLARRDADWKIKFETPAMQILLPHLNSCRGVANLLDAAARSAHHAHHDDEALRRVDQMLKVARLADRTPFVVSHLVALGISRMAGETIGGIVPTLSIGATAGAATVTQVKSLIQTLQDEGWQREAWRQALLAERMSVVDTTSLVIARKVLLTDLINTSAGKPKPAPHPVPPEGVLLSDERRILDGQTVMMTTSESESISDFRTRAAKISPIKTTVPEMGLLFSTRPMENVALTHFAAIAQARAAAASLAAKLWMNDHQQAPPPSLDALVPQYLPAVPDDPLAGVKSPLRYRASPEPTIYSVGRDGKDSGGAITGRGQDIGVKLAGHDS